MKKKPDTLGFLINAAALTFVVMALLQYVHSLLPDPQQPQINAFAPQVKVVDGQQASDIVFTSGGKTVMMVAYASWCPYCRLLMPHVMRLLRAHRLDHMKVVFMSFDRKPGDLAAYMVHEDYTGRFTPYMIKPGTQNLLIEDVREMGGHFDAHIPYIGFFAPNGKMVAELPGNVDNGDLVKTVESLQ